MLKGFLHVSEIIIMIMLIFVMLYQFTNIPRMRMEWERPKLTLLSQDFIRSMDKSGINWMDAADVEARFAAALPTTMGYGLTTLQDVRPVMRVGCVCNHSEFNVLEQQILTSFDLNGVRRTFRLERIDPANLKFSSENDVIVFWNHPDLADDSVDDTSLRRYLAMGNGVVEFSDLQSWQAARQWHEDVFNLVWVDESESSFVRTTYARFAIATSPKMGYKVQKLFYHVPFELVPDSSFVSHYRFNLGRGSTVWDTSLNSNNGVMHDADPGNHDGDNASIWVGGVYGKALRFDGVDDYVQVPNDPRLVVTNELTIEAWVKYNEQTETGNHEIVWSAENWRYSLGRSGDNYRFRIYDTTSGTWQTVDTQGITFDKDEWYHIAATYRNGDRIRIYVDGDPNNEQPIPSITLNPQSGYIRLGAGQSLLPAGEWFDGTMDEVVIYKRALGPGEIKRHYSRRIGKPMTFGNFVSESVYPLDNSNEKIVLEQESRYSGGSFDGKSVPLAAINWDVEGRGRSAWMSAAPLNEENKQLLRSLVIWAAAEKEYEVSTGGELQESVKASLMKVLNDDMPEIIKVDLTLGFYY